MLRKNPGIDVPVATEATILHAAAFLEFKQHAEGLVRKGLHTAGYTCWMHAVEIRHSPFVGPTTSESELFPPLFKMPCCAANCERCAAHLGGFKFPWLGLWSSRGIIVPPGLSPSEAWKHYYAHRDEKLDLLLLSAYSTGVEPAEMVPQEMYALQLRSATRQAGQLGLGELFSEWSIWQRCFPSESFPPKFIDPRLFPRPSRGRPWAALGPEGSRALRALRGWLEAQDAKTLVLGSGCLECGDPTWRACWGCCAGLCSACFDERHACPLCQESIKVSFDASPREET